MSEPSIQSVPPVSTHAGGGRIILWAQAVKFLMRVGSAAVLARLLTPDAYGLHGMAGVVFGLLYMSRDFGIVVALQQPGDIGARLARLRRLGWAGGAGLAVLGLLAGWPAAWLFDEPRLHPVLAAMSIGLIFCGGSAPALGLLHRHQRIATIVRSEVIALAFGTMAACLAAWHGLGVWSLVLMGVVGDLVLAALMWWYCPPEPMARRGAAPLPWRQVLGFSANLSGQGFVAYFARHCDQMVVGWSSGAASLGLYGRGAQIASLPMQIGLAPFNSWIVASLARLQDKPADYVAFFKRALNGLLHLSLAAAAVCLVAPHLVVRAFFGAQWMSSVPVLQWLALGLAVQPLLFAADWLLASTGQVKIMLRLSLLWLGLVLGATLMVADQGIANLALAAALATVLGSILRLAVCTGRTAVTGRDLLTTCVGPLLCHGGWVGLVLLGRTLIELPATDAAGWILLGGTAVVYYSVLMAVSPELRRQIFRHLLVAP